MTAAPSAPGGRTDRQHTDPVAGRLDAAVLLDPALTNTEIGTLVGRPADLESLRRLPDGPVSGAGRHLRSIRIAGEPTILATDRGLLLLVLDGRTEAIPLIPGSTISETAATGPDGPGGPAGPDGPDGDAIPGARLLGEGQSWTVPPGGTLALRAPAGGRPALVLEVHFGDRPASSRPDLAGRVNELPHLPDYYYGYQDRYATVYAAGADSWEPPEPNDVLLRALDALEIKPCAVVDLGCGEGRDAIYLAQLGFSVTAVDVSRAALDKARERASAGGVRVEFLERDVIYLDNLPRGAFDLALNMGCLHMIPDARLRAAHLRGVHDLLRPGGRFVLAHCRERWLEGFYSVPDYGSVGPVVPGRVIPRRIRLRDGGTAMLPLPLVPYKESPAEELARELTAAGLVVEDDLSGDTEAFGNTVVLVARKPG